MAEHGPRPVCAPTPPRQAPTPGTPTGGEHATHACVQAESGPRPEAHARCLLYGVWAHIDSALGPDAATTCGAARYAGKCSAAERVSARRGRHLRRSRQRGCHTDACTEVNIMRAGSNGHAREATKQRQLNTVQNLQRAVGAGQRTSRWVPSGEADSGATTPSRALGAGSSQEWRSLHGPWPGACAGRARAQTGKTARLLPLLSILPTPPRLVSSPGTLAERQQGAI